MTKQDDKIFSDNNNLIRMANHFAAMSEAQQQTAMQNLWETLPSELRPVVLLMANLTVTASMLRQALLFVGLPENKPMIQTVDVQTLVSLSDRVKEITAPKLDPSELN